MGDRETTRRQEVLIIAAESKLWALPTSHVERVFHLDGLTPVPLAPPFIAGLTNFGGVALPLVDLEVLEDGPSVPHPSHPRQAVALRIEPLLLAVAAQRILHIDSLERSERKPHTGPFSPFRYELKGRPVYELDPDRFVQHLRGSIRQSLAQGKAAFAAPPDAGPPKEPPA